MDSQSGTNEKLGFQHWMERVLEEAERAARSFDADAVHDLRVALRRCRSMADGFRSVDPDPAWRAIKKAGGGVFKSLGDLRDVQVMRKWVARFSLSEDTLGPLLDHALAERETALKREAEISLQRLDYEKWRRWSQHLARRAARVPVESPVFQYLALERWHEARVLHQRALRNRSKISWHSLRIGIKRFRYTVENFLPARHEEWGKDLKQLQDLLGEVHDFDVLWDYIDTYGFSDPEVIAHWRTRLGEERAQRIESYRAKMVGPQSLWIAWRARLPQGTEQEAALSAKLQALATLGGSRMTHVKHVSRLALQIYDGLHRSGIGKDHGTMRLILQCAALLQDVGHFSGKRSHHKRSFRALSEMAPPLGWELEHWTLVALLARYHRGGTPRQGQKAFAKIPAAGRRWLQLLGSILRMANALDDRHERVVRSISVSRTEETIILSIEGYNPDSVSIPQLAIAKLMLESACGLPISLRNGTPTAKPAMIRPRK